MTDTVVKGFHKRREAGEVFFNQLNKSLTRISFDGGGAEGQAKVNSCSPAKKLRHKWVGCLILNFIPTTTVNGALASIPAYCLSSSQIEDAKTEAVTAMLSERGRADNNLFETLAEANQTLSMLDSPFKKVDNVLNHVTSQRRRRRPKSNAYYLAQLGKVVSKEAADWYLTWRYGISPIVRDIAGIVEGIQATTNKRRKTTRRKVVVESQQLSTTTYPSILNYSIQRTIEEKLTVRAMCLDEVQMSVFENIGFTAKGLVTLPWELVSYSFVADWFLNLGDFLGALVPTPSWHHLGSCMTVERNTVNRYNVVGTTDGVSNTVLQAGWGTYVRQDIVKTRGPLAMPGITVKSDFRFDRPTRLADAAALLGQKIIRTFG